MKENYNDYEDDFQYNNESMITILFLYLLLFLVDKCYTIKKSIGKLL